MNQQTTYNDVNKDKKEQKFNFIRLTLKRQDIFLHSEITSKVYVAFLLASAFISILFVNLDLQNIPEDFSQYNIPFLSILLFFFDQIPLIFIIPFLVASIILVKFAVIASYDKESMEIINLDKRGYNFSYLLFESFLRVWLPILLISTFFISIIGNLIAGIYYFATYRYISFIKYSYPVSFDYNLYFWLNGFYIEYFIATFTIMAVITFIIGYFELKKMLNSDKEFMPKQKGILFSELKNLFNEYELFIIATIDLILISLGVLTFITTFQKIDIIFLLDKWLRYSISVNGLAILVTFIVMAYLQMLQLNVEKKKLLRRLYIVLWLIFDIFLLIELFSIVSHQKTGIMSIINLLIFGEMSIIIFAALAALSLMEILSRKIYGFFGIFVLYGIYNSGIVGAYQNVFLNILVTLGVILLLFSISSSLINFNMKAGTKLLFPLANLIGENIYLTVPKVMRLRSKFIKLSTQFIFLLVLTSIFSCLTFQTSLNVNSDEAKWKVGADMKIVLSAESKVNTVPIQNIYEMEKHSSVVSATAVYVNNKWFTDYTHQTQTTSIVFIDIHSFKETAFYRDEWFIGGTAEELFEKMQKKPGLIILDEVRAKLIGKSINDTIVLHTGTDSIIYFTARIVGLAKFFSGNYITDEKGIESFAIMNKQFANAKVQNPLSNFVDNGNPVSYYLLKTTTNSNQNQVGNDLLNDPDIKYLEYGVYHQNLIFSKSNVIVNPIVTQFLGLSSILGLIVTPIAFFVITTSVKEEEKKFYRSMSFDFDKSQIKKIIILDLGLSIITPAILGYSLGIVLSVISNQFMPVSTLPIVARMGTLFTVYQIVLFLSIVLSWLYSSQRRLEIMIGKDSNIEEKENILIRSVQKTEKIVKKIIPNKKSVSFYIAEMFSISIVIGIIFTGINYYYTEKLILINNINVIVIFILVCYFIGSFIAKKLLVLHPTKYTVRAIFGIIFQFLVLYFLQILEASNSIIITIIGLYSVLIFSLLINKNILMKISNKQILLLLLASIIVNIYSIVLIFEESISSLEKMILEQLTGNYFANNLISLSITLVITGLFFKIFLENIEDNTKN